MTASARLRVAALTAECLVLAEHRVPDRAPALLGRDDGAEQRGKESGRGEKARRHVARILPFFRLWYKTSVSQVFQGVVLPHYAGGGLLRVSAFFASDHLVSPVGRSLRVTHRR